MQDKAKSQHKWQCKRHSHGRRTTSASRGRRRGGPTPQRNSSPAHLRSSASGRAKSVRAGSCVWSSAAPRPGARCASALGPARPCRWWPCRRCCSVGNERRGQQGSRLPQPDGTWSRSSHHEPAAVLPPVQGPMAPGRARSGSPWGVPRHTAAVVGSAAVPSVCCFRENLLALQMVRMSLSSVRRALGGLQGTGHAGRPAVTELGGQSRLRRNPNNDARAQCVARKQGVWLCHPSLAETRLDGSAETPDSAGY